MILATGNISKSGLMPEGNYEAGVFIDSLSNADRLFFENIIIKSKLVNDELYQQLLEWYEQQPKISKQENMFEQIINPITKNDFLISALPMTRDVDILIRSYENINNDKSPSQDEEITSCVYHDLANYRIELGLTRDEFLSKLKKQFFSHPFVKRIDGFINPEAYFGSVKEWIQKNCTDVPIPSRRELTGNVQVLYEWFEKLGDGKYLIDIPGTHSQRIRRVKP